VQEDDDMDRDGNDFDGDGAHPQKHAKSPELAREFLLDAAAVIFKEQVLTKKYCNIWKSVLDIMVLTFNSTEGKQLDFFSIFVNLSSQLRWLN
jgi:hypothetical protein